MILNHAVQAIFSAFYRIPESNMKMKARLLIIKNSSKLPKSAFISPGDDVVLVGTPFAHRVDTLAKYADNAVIFEAERNNFAKLQNTAKEYDNITVRNKAVWSESGKKKLQVAADENPGDHKIQVDGIEHDNDYRSENYIGQQEIEVDTLDNLLADINITPDHLEIMVNGAELEVLRGATETIQVATPRMWIKGHARDESGYPINRKIREFLGEYGYSSVLSKSGQKTVTDIEGWECRDGDVYAWKR